MDVSVGAKSSMVNCFLHFDQLWISKIFFDKDFICMSIFKIKTLYV